MSRAQSTITAETTPVAMNASLPSPDLMRNAERNAPWFPDRKVECFRVVPNLENEHDQSVDRAIHADETGETG